MNFWESAIISGMAPRTGRLPLPSLRTKAFTACNITQKDGVWWTYSSNKPQHDKFEWSNKNVCVHLIKTANTCDVRLLHCSLLKRSSTTLGICGDQRQYNRNITTCWWVALALRNTREVWSQDGVSWLFQM